MKKFSNHLIDFDNMLVTMKISDENSKTGPKSAFFSK
jgi:hypothetical protein